jgi:hypothetical protein
VKVEPASSSPSLDNTIRFTSTRKPLGKTISYVIKMIRSGKPIVLQGIGLAMTKVVTVAGIVRDRVGDVHQKCEFFPYDIKDSPNEGTGVQITLSTHDLSAGDAAAVGYSRPEPKGFMQVDRPAKPQFRKRRSEAHVAEGDADAKAAKSSPRKTNEQKPPAEAAKTTEAAKK